MKWVTEAGVHATKRQYSSGNSLTGWSGLNVRLTLSGGSLTVVIDFLLVVLRSPIRDAAQTFGRIHPPASSGVRAGTCLVAVLLRSSFLSHALASPLR